MIDPNEPTREEVVAWLEDVQRTTVGAADAPYLDAALLLLREDGERIAALEAQLEVSVPLAAYNKVRDERRIEGEARARIGRELHEVKAQLAETESRRIAELEDESDE